MLRSFLPRAIKGPDRPDTLCNGFAEARPRSSVRQAADEIDDRGVDLAGALLLSPVAAAGEHQYVAQCGDEMFEVGEQLVRAGKQAHHVPITATIDAPHRHP